MDYPYLHPQPDDEDCVVTADKSVRQRIVIERAIIRQACADLIAAGFTLRLHDGEDWSTGKTTDIVVIMAALMATDEEGIQVFKGDKVAGSLFLVYGNDGWDVIADNSSSVEPYLKGANALSDLLCQKVHGA